MEVIRSRRFLERYSALTDINTHNAASQTAVPW
jgi:hypothetical protein